MDRLLALPGVREGLEADDTAEVLRVAAESRSMNELMVSTRLRTSVASIGTPQLQ